jgi:hypothetical protein
VVYALVEGLAGVRDLDTAFDRAEVAPRWLAANTDEADVCIHYPASDGYVAYRYQHDAERKTIRLNLTGSGEDFQLRLLLPPGASIARRGERELPTESVGGSVYALLEESAMAPVELEVVYA